MNELESPLRQNILNFCSQWRTFEDMQGAHLMGSEGTRNSILWGTVKAMVDEDLLMRNGADLKWSDKRRNEWVFDHADYIDMRCIDTIPLCELCGKPLSCEASGPDGFTYACSGLLRYENGKAVWAEGRGLVDEHYSKSSRTFFKSEQAEIYALKQRLWQCRKENEKKGM